MVTGSPDTVCIGRICTAQRQMPCEQVQILPRGHRTGGTAEFLGVGTGELLRLFILPDNAAHGMTNSHVSGFVCVQSTDQQVPFPHRFPYQLHQLSPINRHRNNMPVLCGNDVGRLAGHLHFRFRCPFQNFHYQPISCVPHAHPCRFLYGSADPVFTVPEIDRRNPAAPLYAAFFQNRCDLRCGNGVVGNHLDLHDDVGTVEQQSRCKQNSQRHPEPETVSVQKALQSAAGGQFQLHPVCLCQFLYSFAMLCVKAKLICVSLTTLFPAAHPRFLHGVDKCIQFSAGCRCLILSPQMLFHCVPPLVSV